MLAPLSPSPTLSRPRMGSIDKTVTWSTCEFCQEPFSLVIMEVNAVQEVLHLFEFQIWPSCWKHSRVQERVHFTVVLH